MWANPFECWSNLDQPGYGMGILNGSLPRCKTIYVAGHICTHTKLRPSAQEMQCSRRGPALGTSQLPDTRGHWPIPLDQNRFFRTTVRSGHCKSARQSVFTLSGPVVALGITNSYTSRRLCEGKFSFLIAIPFITNWVYSMALTQKIGNASPLLKD